MDQALMQLGFDKKRIKLRNKCIFIDNKLYGQYQNSELCRSDYNPPLPAKPSTTQSFSNAASAPNQWLPNYHYTIFYTNPRSIINKLKQFQSLIYSKFFDIIALTEIWLTNS